MSYQVERESLLDAAKSWGSAETDMTTAQRNANAINVTQNAASVVAELTGFITTYDQVRDRVATLLGEGATAMRLIDDTLKGIERQYRNDDDAALARLGATWSPTNT
ncbi:hypothetical protein N802_01020 [Knoellia sinensis KCTC 19936]|uniref:ESX-1 secretion-associated protein n=1 Tax=Knoellia sinensis KCTC 19936 TaxID=1385520 RepID=A0A0A0JG25_9MICO|nr:hypothetical protein [Knoellia sinensis]KGN34997.1 hypothetical protein N802_01020 [Knoellia sinensis KCTC 19936]